MIRSLAYRLIGLAGWVLLAGLIAFGFHAAGWTGPIEARPASRPIVLAISGAERTSLPALQDAAQGAALDARAWHHLLRDMPWVDRAAVKLRADGVTYVQLEEYQPFAVWQMDQTASLIDQQGRVLKQAVAEDFAQLPLIIGPGAPEAAPALIDAVQADPDLRKRIYAAVRVGQRRWDILFQNGIRVMLAEDSGQDMHTLWRRFATLEQRQALLSREITHIDLRLPGQVRVSLTNRGRALVNAEKRET